MDRDAHGRELRLIGDLLGDSQPQLDRLQRVLAADHHRVADRLDLLAAMLRQQPPHVCVQAQRDLRRVVVPLLGREHGEPDQVHE